MKNFCKALILILSLTLAVPAFSQIMGVTGNRKVFTYIDPVPAPAWDSAAGTSCNPIPTVGSNTFTCVLSSVAAGEVGIVSYQGPNQVPISVKDNGVDVVPIFTQAWVANFAYQAAYYTIFSTTGSHTITFTFASAINPPAIQTRTLTGADTSAVIDGTPVGQVFSGANAVACGAITTTHTNDLIVAIGNAGGMTALTPAAGYTSLANVGDNHGNEVGVWEWKTGSRAGSFNPNYTGGVDHTGCIAFAVKHL